MSTRVPHFATLARVMSARATVDASVTFCSTRTRAPSSRARLAARARASNVDDSAPRDGVIFALDFDGVVCDSVGESSLSAWRHGTELWPEIFATEGADRDRDRVLDALRAVRPVVETGYENTTLARALLENLPGYSVEEILDDWDALSPKLMER